MSDNTNIPEAQEGLFNPNELPYQQNEGLANLKNLPLASVLNENKTQKDTSTKNEIHVVPHQEVNAEDNQSLAKRITLTEGAPKIKDGPDKEPSIVEKNLQVDQEGNVISAEPEKQAQEQPEKKQKIDRDLFGMATANAAEPETEKDRQLKSMLPFLTGNIDLGLKNIIFNAAKKATGHGEPETQHNIFENVAYGIADAGVKTVIAGYSISKDINELKKDGLFIDPKKTAEFEQWMSQNMLGKIGTDIEEEAKKSAISQFVSLAGQFYLAQKILRAEKLAVKGFQWANRLGASEEELAAYTKGKEIVEKYIQAGKDGKLLTPNKYISDAYEKVAQLNNLSKAQKFGVIAVGGLVGGALITDYAETAFGLDQDVRNDTQDDAWRRIDNRLMAGLQAFIAAPVFHYGISKVGQAIAERGKFLSFSNSQLDRLIDYVSSGFRSRNIQSPELKALTDRAIGQQDVSKNTAKYLTDSIDITLNKISNKSGIKEGNPAYTTIMQKLNTLLNPVNNEIENSKVVFNGFTEKELKDFRNFSNNVGISKTNTEELIGHIVSARNIFADYVNTMLANGNIQINASKFNKIISDRIINMMKYDFQIHADKNTGVPMLNYKPVANQLEAAGQILKDYAAKSGKILDDDEVKVQLQTILKNVKLDPVTKIPSFKITNYDSLGVKEAPVINIADNFKGGNFKPTKFFKTENDLNSFLKFFGQAEPNIKNTIINTMMDLGTLTARDNFYTQLLNKSKELIKNGERSILYPTKLAAENPKTGLAIASEGTSVDSKLPWNRTFPKGNIINKGLDISSSLDPSVYANPINGWFTSELYKDAIEFNQKLATDFLTKNIIYRNLFLVPKAITQMNKTIFDPFTHTKIFTVNSTFALGNGNLTLDPRVMMKIFNESWDTLQPQLVSKFTTKWGTTLGKVGTLGLSWRNSTEAQKLYNFLLERRVVYSVSDAQDLRALLSDIQNGGPNLLNKIYDKFGDSMKKLVKIGHDSYMGGDDIWKIYNFLAEVYKRENAYNQAIINKIITPAEKPSTLDIWNKAAQIVGDVFPNYNQVGTNIRNLRRLPMGNFPSFHAEVVRAGGNTIWEGLQEMKDPVLRSIGKNRLFSFGLTTAAVIPTIQGIVHGLYGITNNMVAAANDFLPGWSKNSQVILFKDKDGKLNYVDAQGNFVYDAFVGPVASALAGVDNAKSLDPNTPFIKGAVQGLVSHLAKLTGPYLSAPMLVEAVMDIFSREGADKDGHRIWNQSAPLGDKVTNATLYAANKLAPLGFNRLEKLYYAINNAPGPKGQQYRVPYVLASLLGNQAFPLNIEVQFPIKISDYEKKLNQSNQLFSTPLRSNPAIDSNTIVQNWIKEQAARWDAMKDMAQTIQNAKTLNFGYDKTIPLFQKRIAGPELSYLLANDGKGIFYPRNVTATEIQSYYLNLQKLNNSFPNKIYDDQLGQALGQISNVLGKLAGKPLKGSMYDYINPNDYIIKKPGDQSNLQTPVNNKQVFNIAPVNTPNVNPQTVTPNPQQTSATQNEFQRAFPQG